jgi:hypothetical protein
MEVQIKHLRAMDLEMVEEHSLFHLTRRLGILASTTIARRILLLLEATRTFTQIILQSGTIASCENAIVKIIINCYYY